MTPDFLLRHAIDPALELLPEKMRDPKCRPFLVAIALQESRIKHRRQIGGPARGFWQFEERGGVAGVLRHPKTTEPIRDVLDALAYHPSSWSSLCYEAIEYDDILAAAFARCLLWTLPEPLPERHQLGRSWDQYLDAWRPGKPHPETWDRFWRQAWEVVGD